MPSYRGASLCSGQLHPDFILSEEQHLTACKKAYESELLKYHNEFLDDNTMESLQKLKERWMGCEGPESDIVEKMWRFLFLLCSAHFLLLVGLIGSAERHGNILAASERSNMVTSFRKEDKQQRMYIRSGDGAKYMSYFKITRKQHELVKGIKQPGGIKSKSLNHVLGDIRSIRVQPYEAFEEEEEKKLHEHWLQLANRDLPSAFANWKEMLMQRKQLRRSLEQEIKENKKAMEYEDEEGNPGVPHKKHRDTGEAYKTAMDIQNCEAEESAPHSLNSSPLQRIPSLNGHHELERMNVESEEESKEIIEPEDAEPMNMEPEGDGLEITAVEDALPVLLHSVEDTNSEVFEHNAFLHSADGSLSCTTNNQALQRIPSLNGHPELDALDMELGDSRHNIPEPENGMTIVSQFIRNVNPTEDAVEQQPPIPSSKEAWLEVGLPDSYYQSRPLNHGYTSSNEFSIEQPHFIRERSIHLIDVETDVFARDAKLRRSSDDITSGFHIDTAGTFSGCYSNQDLNELHQPFLKGQGLAPSQADQKQVELQFLGTNNVLLETPQHPGHLQEQQQQLLKQRQQMSDRDYYMHQVNHKNMHSSGGRHLSLSQELLTPINRQNWAVDSAHLPASLQAFSAGGRELLSENTSPGEHRARGSWSRMDVSSSGQCLGNGSNADGSLYSVLTQYSKAQSGSFNLMDTSEQTVGGGMSNTSNVFPHTGHQLNFLNGHEATNATLGAMKTNNTSWMNSAHQSSGRHDSVGQPSSLRSWNS
ncbi:hypothetical protein IFM89_014635 [Coptis chinensis]|uniref:Uncharacterized protein n=1 Tax=Coptis chinensis TaxID=261450 RepID=A0A835HVS8_9MAGN|nr:hypothetical protein IFM89_014635 [Coptis chinensis]